MARDRHADGQFVFAVTTTGIYCRPSCPARRPRPAHVRFFADGDAAAREGFRPCLRCTPDEAGREARVIASALATIAAAETPPRLAVLAGAAGYSPGHFQRLFTRATGISPAAYARALRHKRAEAALAGLPSVTDALYEAGFNAPSRFYEAASARLGMAPSARARGGQGEAIRWAVAETTLGPILVAATEKGVCRVAFGEGEVELATRFPRATLLPQDETFAALLAEVVAAIETPARPHAIPLDVQGTVFQEKVWQELRRIPPGETRSYAQLAASIGHPTATRAVGSANGANPLAVLTPCHRVVRADGSLGGYAWGEGIKRELLRRERVGN
jgi:AraC family transcriptional regulator of adaptative response/methylated-DNA-[protein]-cysteine methyltransferase